MIWCTLTSYVYYNQEMRHNHFLLACLQRRSALTFCRADVQNSGPLFKLRFTELFSRWLQILWWSRKMTWQDTMSTPPKSLYEGCPSTRVWTKLITDLNPIWSQAGPHQRYRYTMTYNETKRRKYNCIWRLCTHQLQPEGNQCNNERNRIRFNSKSSAEDSV